jgi:hypothetical protein
MPARLEDDADLRNVDRVQLSPSFPLALRNSSWRVAYYEFKISPQF